MRNNNARYPTTGIPSGNPYQPLMQQRYQPNRGPSPAQQHQSAYNTGSSWNSMPMGNRSQSSPRAGGGASAYQNGNSYGMGGSRGVSQPHQAGAPASTATGGVRRAPIRRQVTELPTASHGEQSAPAYSSRQSSAGSNGGFSRERERNPPQPPSSNYIRNQRTAAVEIPLSARYDDSGLDYADPEPQLIIDDLVQQQHALGGGVAAAGASSSALCLVSPGAPGTLEIAQLLKGDRGEKGEPGDNCIRAVGSSFIPAGHSQITIQFPETIRGRWDKSYRVFLTPRTSISSMLWLPAETGLDSHRNQITVCGPATETGCDFDWMLVGPPHY